MLVELADQRHQMQACRRAWTVRQRSGDHLHAVRLKQSAYLGNSVRVGAIALADQKRGWVQPDHVAGFGFSWRAQLTCQRNTKIAAEFNMTPRFRNPLRLAGIQADQAA